MKVNLYCDECEDFTEHETVKVSEGLKDADILKCSVCKSIWQIWITHDMSGE